MKNQNLIYKVTSNEHTGLAREFCAKAPAVAYARGQRKDGWNATVIDMRTGKAILRLDPKPTR